MVAVGAMAGKAKAVGEVVVGAMAGDVAGGAVASRYADENVMVMMWLYSTSKPTTCATLLVAYRGPSPPKSQ